jgi:hypothetical protein
MKPRELHYKNFYLMAKSPASVQTFLRSAPLNPSLSFTTAS